MSASLRVLADLAASRRKTIRLLGASGQLGYGIPTPAFEAGLARAPDLIGCDMGSTDIGPTYLGRGEMATAPEATRRDLRKVLLGARRLDVPLVIGSAGSAGARPHLEATLAMVREIARGDGLRFRFAVLRADIPKPLLSEALRADEVRSFDGSPALTADEIASASNIVAQMGTSAIRRALAADVDVVIAGRSCDTAIFAALPEMAGFPMGLAMHAAKIIECASLCCIPGGRDSILATLDHEGFELESMAPHRSATPVSVAAHSLYEQGDPYTVAEPEGRLDLSEARYEAIDDRRTRVSGARWQGSADPWVKLEGARHVGERAVLLAGSADPRFIARSELILAEVANIVRELVCEGSTQDYALFWRLYGRDGVRAAVPSGEAQPGEIFVMAECIAPTRERALEVVRTTKQYLLHHGYPGRLSTAGNLAFPFTPPEVSAGPAYRFNIYHLMRAQNLDALFPLEVETI
ncbi:MAG: acyclic terpene utilization AtuA family protein [Acetobacteraceae bacterium]|nr:acyclic terpene utilization AtuA family protein [Acetobacteraceae bacterium]